MMMMKAFHGVPQISAVPELPTSAHVKPYACRGSPDELNSRPGSRRLRPRRDVLHLADPFGGLAFENPVAFTTALTAGSVGLFAGSLLCGVLGDRLGRKPVLMGAVAIFGLTALLTATAKDPVWLSVTRLLTGFGIGGGIPTTIALLSDLAPPKKQGGLVMATMCGVQVGNVLAGVAASRLIAHWGWPSVFVLGGLMPLFILPAMALWLPETFTARKSAGFCFDSTAVRGRLRALHLDTLADQFSQPADNLFGQFVASFAAAQPGHRHRQRGARCLQVQVLRHDGHLGERAAGQPVRHRECRRGASCHRWMLLDPAGLGPRFRASLRRTGIRGWPQDLGRAGWHQPALSGTVYPLRLRGTGAGWALGVGRMGNITGPLFGGLLLTLGWQPGPVLQAMAVPAFALTLALLLLAHMRARPLTA